MSREELDIIRYIVEQAYNPKNDDYVNWNYVRTCEGILEKYDKKSEEKE